MIDYNQLKILVRRGYFISQACEIMGVPRIRIYRSITKEQQQELKQIKQNNKT